MNRNDDWWRCKLCRRRFSGHLHNESDGICTDCHHTLLSRARDEVAFRLVSFLWDKAA